MGIVDCVEQVMQTAFFQRGDINNLGPAQEVQLAFKFFLHAASFVIVQAVPLVDTDHQGTTAFENVARNVGILFGNTGVRMRRSTTTLELSIA